MELTPEATPVQSRRSSESSSPTSRSSRSPAPPSLDFSQLPGMIQPSPATNTLLFTNLDDADIFRPENLEKIRSLIGQTSAVHTWTPLRSFRRIVVSFLDTDAALAVRAVWDGEAIMGERIRVYFGAPTAVEVRDEHLALPDAGKLFFISPPPSPPAGWEMKLEDAPNKQVHADDLADALARLHKKRSNSADMGDAGANWSSSSSPALSPTTLDDNAKLSLRTRSGSATLIYMPDEHDAAELPAIAVEDTTSDGSDNDYDGAESPRLMAHTSRPPLELMQC